MALQGEQVVAGDRAGKAKAVVGGRRHQRLRLLLRGNSCARNKTCCYRQSSATEDVPAACATRFHPMCGTLSLTPSGSLWPSPKYFTRPRKTPRHSVPWFSSLKSISTCIAHADAEKRAVSWPRRQSPRAARYSSIARMQSPAAPWPGNTTRSASAISLRIRGQQNPVLRFAHSLQRVDHGT